MSARPVILRGICRRHILELDLLLEPETRHIGLNVGDHRLDRLRDVGGIGGRAKTIDRIAHPQRRFRGVQNDDGLAARGAPTTSMAWDVVSVNSSILARVPGPADSDAIEATISA